ncbi:MAG: DUF5723 family protein [candidate division WOR-3 bacterium]|nr:DUF5723 family protein [candidate division WOR-3 bacterium]
MLLSGSHLSALSYDYLNPAELYLYTNSENYHYSLKYLNAHFDFLNNSLNLKQIINNFIDDNKWDSLQKATIFNTITSPFFSLNGNAMLMPIKFSTRLFNVSVQYQELVDVDVPKDLFDLLFWGNDLNRSYNIANISFNRIGYYDFGLGVNYPIIQDFYEESKLNNLNVGIKVHWLKGRYVTKTDSCFGSVLTTPGVLIGEVQLFQKTAKGGNCFAFDIGGQAQFLQAITIGLAMLNINTGFHWTSSPTYRILNVTIDSFSLQRYLDYGSIDSVYHKYDSLKSLAPFKTNLPTQILVQASYQPNWLITLKTNYHQYLSKDCFTDNFYRSLNFGICFNFIKYLASELTFTTNLKQNFAIGTNFYITIKGFNLSLLTKQLNGLFRKAKGAGVEFYFGQNW